MRDLSTWLLICTCTWVGLGASVQGEGGGLGAGSLTCLSNNVLRIDCRWSALELGQGPSPWLLFTSNQALGSKHRCVFRAGGCTLVLPPEEALVPSDSFTITLHRYVSGGEQVSLVDPQYLPRRHVKLDPPSDLQSNVTSHYCVLTWSVGPALEPLAALLSYELAFKKQEEAWEQARLRDRVVGVTRLSLEAVELEPGGRYEARLRVRMATPEREAAEELHYEGQWSEWSQSVRFPSPRSPARGPLWSPWGQPNSSTLVAVPVFLLLTSLTYLVFKLSPRVKRSLYRNVPSPEAFFQSLYSVHDGNFQEPRKNIEQGSPRFQSVVQKHSSELSPEHLSSVEATSFSQAVAVTVESPATWMGAHRTSLLPRQDRGGSPRGASESSVHEAIAWLTYDVVDPWQPGVLEEEEEGPGAGLLEAVLLAPPVVQGGHPPAYLPQEDWGPAPPGRPAPPLSEGSSGDYWALGCSGGCHSPTFPGDTPSSGPSPALAGGLSCDRQSLDAWPESSAVGASHGQWQDPVAWVA